MNRSLSQGDIDALLIAAAGRTPSPAGQPSAPEPKVTPYNFRRPDRISKEQLRSLHFLHDRYAVNVSTSLSAFLRAITELRLISVEQFAYSEFLMSLPDPTAYYAFTMAPLEGMGALEINPSIAFAMVDRMLGGSGTTPAPDRAMTEIEQNVLDSVVKVLLEHLTETWHTTSTDVQFQIFGRETRPQMLRVTAHNEVVILLVLEIRIGESRGTLSLCFPAGAIESTQDKVAEGWHRTRRAPTATEEARLLANLGRVPLPVTTLLDVKLPAGELLALRPGDVLSLGYSISNPVDIQVGQVRRFAGRLTTQDGSAAVRIDQVSEYPFGGAQ